jgi:hypothetical protein
MMLKELNRRFGEITNLHTDKGSIKFDKVLPKNKKVAGSTRLKVSIPISELSD